ncbi:hypothetical protein EYR41_010784 [Orbilia oligospora]|uniref:Uncharacterized protein n=1 Tax=Orbilia oligospora TaxID=2813651 RepID=A0A7C8PWQ6_ORBOL|nr:hypothetical protein TWF751_007362 [Orbilia oligospora]KAF3287049.1 hypothetical protein TWF132_008734 [Orbilia oligospora]TGJ64748.1 hypothetical protein EYR41_010784 [Orbilia oligospora]
MLFQNILPLLSILLGLTVTANAADANASVDSRLAGRAPDLNAPPLCRLAVDWVMIADGRSSTFSWPYDQVQMKVWVKDDQKAGWSGWPGDATAVLNNFDVDNNEKGEWINLTQDSEHSSTCDATERGQCWTHLKDRPILRASPQHGKRDDGWKGPDGAVTGDRYTMRDYIQFYWGPPDAVKLAWHTDENGSDADAYIYDTKKNPYCRLRRDDPAKGVSWQYYIDGSLHVYVNDKTNPAWAVAEGWDIECLFFCPI